MAGPTQCLCSQRRTLGTQPKSLAKLLPLGQHFIPPNHIYYTPSITRSQSIKPLYWLPFVLLSIPHIKQLRETSLPSCVKMFVRIRTVQLLPTSVAKMCLTSRARHLKSSVSFSGATKKKNRNMSTNMIAADRFLNSHITDRTCHRRALEPLPIGLIFLKLRNQSPDIRYPIPSFHDQSLY